VHRPSVAAGGALAGYFAPEDSFWSDLGTPERYLGAHREFLARGTLPPETPGRLATEDEVTLDGGRVRAPSYLGPGARVEAGGVAGPFAVLGAGAIVGRRARVEGSVLWAGAVTADEGLRESIVSSSGTRLRVGPRDRA
jgi:mannose-1-phosphate guanylyltransferase